MNIAARLAARWRRAWRPALAWLVLPAIAWSGSSGEHAAFAFVFAACILAGRAAMANPEDFVHPQAVRCYCCISTATGPSFDGAIDTPGKQCRRKCPIRST